MKNGDSDLPATPRRPTGRGERLYADEPETLGELFRQAAEKFPNTKILNFKRGAKWLSISGEEMFLRMHRCASGLNALGIQKGHRIAILAPNSPEWTITDGACQLAGIVDVPIYPTLSPASVEYILHDSGARILFLQDRGSYESLREALENVPTIEKIVLFEANPGEREVLAFDQLHGSFDQPDGYSNARAAPDDIATLIYTSGTTGEPKGVMLTHNCIISNVIDAGEKYDFATHDIPLSVLPLSHIFERSAMYLYLYHGMEVHYAESVDKVPEDLGDVRPTIFVGVPRIFEKVYARAKLGSAQAGGLKEKIFDWAI